MYQIDTPLALSQCLNAFLTAFNSSPAETFHETSLQQSQSGEDALITDITGGEYPISSDLYRRYSGILRRAVDAVPMDDTDLQAQWHANVSRIAAYKAFHATQDIRSAVREDGDIERGRAKLHAYNRYQAAEYNTAVARARTGKQWLHFSEKDNLRLFPCIKWLPSRSADPRELHQDFYFKVWPKDDTFWLHNQPGTLWNCKCDWEQTDEEPTDGNPTKTVAAPGLGGNPATTGEIFSTTPPEKPTDPDLRHPYIKRAGRNRKEREAIEELCQRANQDLTIDDNKPKLTDKTTQCTVLGTKYDVLFEPVGIDHYAQDCFGNKKMFWIKNQILPNIDSYINNATCIARKVSDATHNTRKKTKKLKEKTDYFYYFPIRLPNGENAVLHLGRYNNKKIGKEGKMYLYSITKKIPENAEML